MFYRYDIDQGAVLFNAYAAGKLAPVRHLPAAIPRPAAWVLPTTAPDPVRIRATRSPNTRPAGSSTSTPSSGWTPPARTTSRHLVSIRRRDAIGQAAAACCLPVLAGTGSARAPTFGVLDRCPAHPPRRH